MPFRQGNELNQLRLSGSRCQLNSYDRCMTVLCLASELSMLPDILHGE